MSDGERNATSQNEISKKILKKDLTSVLQYDKIRMSGEGTTRTAQGSRPQEETP